MKDEYDRVVYEEIKELERELDGMEKRMQIRTDIWGIVVLMALVAIEGARIVMGLI